MYSRCHRHHMWMVWKALLDHFWITYIVLNNVKKSFALHTIQRTEAIKATGKHHNCKRSLVCFIDEISIQGKRSSWKEAITNLFLEQIFGSVKHPPTQVHCSFGFSQTKNFAPPPHATEQTSSLAQHTDADCACFLVAGA